VLVVHLKDPVLCYCRPGGTRWFRHEYRPEEMDPDDRDGVIGAMAALLVGAGAGTFYAYLSLLAQQLAGGHAPVLIAGPDADDDDHPRRQQAVPDVVLLHEVLRAGVLWAAVHGAVLLYAPVRQKGLACRGAEA
jgi:hypothetical protein